MRRVIDESELLGALKGGASRQRIELRTVASQVSSLEQGYRSLLLAPTRPSACPVRRVAFLVGITGAPLRYRAILPAEALRDLGVDASVHQYRDVSGRRSALEADVVVLYRVPATHQIIELIELLRARGTPTLFDVDDLIVDPDVADDIPALRIIPESERELWLQGVRRYRTTLEHCAGFIGSTRALTDQVAALTQLPVALFENGVGSPLAKAAEQAVMAPRTAGPLRVGYFSGTTTHDEDLVHGGGVGVRRASPP